jgi:hypothetical protein
MSSVVIATFLWNFLASAVGVTRIARRTDGARPRWEVGGTWPNIRDPGGSPHVTGWRAPN